MPDHLLPSEPIAQLELSSASVLHTISFITAFVGPTQSILEVGCGDGQLAQAMLRAGYQIKAVEQNEELADAAQGRGVSVECVDFLRYDTSERFDCIAFTRSLHHIESMSDALLNAKRLLRDGGRLILEEFAAESIDEFGANWLHNLQAVVSETGLLTRCTGFGHEREHAAPPIQLWREHHFGKHKVWPSEKILESVREVFSIEHLSQPPYLYRYIADHLMDAGKSFAIGSAVRAWEEQLIADSQMPPIGLRVVAY